MLGDTKFLHLQKQLRKYLMHSFFSVKTIKKAEKNPSPKQTNQTKHTKKPHQTQTKQGESKLGT